MPAGPLGWICQMHWEHGCEFVLAAQGLAPAEVGSGAWLGPTLPGRIEGVAPFHLHLSLLLLPGGEFEGWRVGGGRVGGVGGCEGEGYGGVCPWLGGRGGGGVGGWGGWGGWGGGGGGGLGGVGRGGGEGEGGLGAWAFGGGFPTNFSGEPPIIPGGQAPLPPPPSPPAKGKHHHTPPPHN